MYGDSPRFPLCASLKHAPEGHFVRNPLRRPLAAHASASSCVAGLAGVVALLCTVVVSNAPASAAAAQDADGLTAKRAAFAASHRVVTDAPLPDAPSQQRAAQADALGGDAASSSDGCTNDFHTDPRDARGPLDILSTLLQHCTDSPPYFFIDVQTYQRWSREQLDAVFVSLDTDLNGATGCVGDEFFVIGYVDVELGLIADVVKTPDCDDSTWSYRGEAFIEHRGTDASVRMSWDAAQVESPRAVRYVTDVSDEVQSFDLAPDSGSYTLRMDGTPPPPRTYPTPTARDIRDTCDRRLGTPFVDTVGTTHEYSVNCASAYRITSGKTPVTYDPNGTLTQGQTATFLVNTLRAYGVMPPERDRFCNESDVHTENMERLMAAFIIPRPVNGVCGPTVTISRERMALWTSGTLAYRSVQGDPSTDWYSDDDASPNTRQINEVTSLGVATGKGNALYGPTESLTRGQMATFLARSLDAMRNGG